MFELSLDTARFLAAIIFLFGFLSMIVLRSRYKDDFQGFMQFVLLYGLSSISYFLIAFIPPTNIILGILIPYLTLLLARMLLLVGFIRFYNIRRRLRTMWLNVVLFSFIALYFSFGSVNTVAIIITYSLFEVIIILHIIMMAVMEHRNRYKELRYIILMQLCIITVGLSRIIILTSSTINETYYAYNELALGLIFLVFISQILYLIDSKKTHQLEKSLYDANFFANIYYNAPVGIVVINRQKQIFHMNEALAKLFGVNPKEVQGTLFNNTYYDIRYALPLSRVINRFTEDNNKATLELDLLNSSKETIQSEIHLTAVYEHHRIEYIEAFVFDLTERIRQRDRLISSEDRLKRAQSISRVGSWELDLETNVVWASDITFEIYELEHVADDKNRLDFTIAQQLVDKKDRSRLDKALHDLIEHNKPYDVEFTIHTLHNNTKHIASKATIKYDDYHNAQRVHGVIRDITTLKENEKKLEYISYHDYLTGLYNRRFIEEEMKRLDTPRNLPISIIMADLNGLKFVNDTLGHQKGDELLQLTAKVFEEVLREDDLIARLGGDEFLIVLPQTTKQETKEIIDRIYKEQQKKEEETNGILSIAMGYSIKREKETPLASIVDIAEDYMYKEKMYQQPSFRRTTIDTIIQALFEKDPQTEVHSRNVEEYASKLAKAAGLSTTQINKIKTAALLHDIGKIVLSDDVLLNTGTLTKEQYNVIKEHPNTGYRILNAVEDLNDIAFIILHHHERIDGTGYPSGVKGFDIPKEAKIISICDAYDAMVGKRLYREMMTKEEAIEELHIHKGTQFDKALTDIFIHDVLLA